jgi:hypothetical protein
MSASEDHKESKIDLAKVEATLKRAAETAINGSRAEQSGRILLPSPRSQNLKSIQAPLAQQDR